MVKRASVARESWHPEAPRRDATIAAMSHDDLKQFVRLVVDGMQDEGLVPRTWSAPPSRRRKGAK